MYKTCLQNAFPAIIDHMTHLHVAGGKEAGLATKLAMKPVLIDLFAENNYLAFLKR